MSLAGGMYSPFIQSIYYLVVVTTFICFFLLVMVVTPKNTFRVQ